jgi:hypothetical protein
MLNFIAATVMAGLDPATHAMLAGAPRLGDGGC